MLTTAVGWVTIATACTGLVLAPAIAEAQRATRIRLDGLVIDATSRDGLASVEVRIDDTVRAVTDANGNFGIENVIAATHRIAFGRVGYEPKSYLLPIAEADQALYVSVALEPLLVERIHVRSRIEGAVIDAVSRRGIRGVNLLVDDTLRAVTDPRGMFEIRDVLPGWRRIRLNRIGYATRLVELPIEWTNQRLFLSLPVQPLAVLLDPVIVRGDTATSIIRGRLAEFFRRQHQYDPFGRFLTRREIERRMPLRVSSLLLAFPGVRVDHDGNVTIREAAAGINEPTGRRCPPALYLNGMYLSGARIDDLAHPEDLAAIEVYRSPVTTPLELARSGTCGAIVLWTR